MTLIDTIKSLLGIDDGRGSDASAEDWFDDDTRAAEPDASSEAAVKGTEDEPTGTDESAAIESDAAASTGSMTEETNESDAAAENAEAAGPTDGSEDDLELDHSGAETTGETTTESHEADGVVDDEVGENAEASAAAGGDAAASTGSMTEETNDSISATENAEAAGPTDSDPAESTADADTEALKGIGPSYSETLAEAGIETVADLAESDPDEIAAETGLSESRIEQWTERAKARRQ